MIFIVEGIHVNSDHVCNDKFCTIHLDNLSNDSSGAYRCEVSGDAPEFKLSHETNNMTVAGKKLCKCKLFVSILHHVVVIVNEKLGKTIIFNLKVCHLFRCLLLAKRLNK